MARSNGAAAAGHNSKQPLTEDEQSALATHYELKIIEDGRKVDALMVDLKAARDKVNGHYKRMTADLGFTRKEFEAEVVELGRLSEAEYASREAKRTRLHVLAGRKPGEQLSLIDKIADTVDEAIAAEAAGYRAGRRADDPTPPKEVSPVLHQDWMRGYHAGQEFNGLQLTKAAEILARPKPGQMAAGENPDETEEDEDADLDAEARALKASGWAGPTADEAKFEEANDGKTIRRPRANRQSDGAAAA
jgi:hypothetical protein